MTVSHHAKAHHAAKVAHHTAKHAKKHHAKKVAHVKHAAHHAAHHHVGGAHKKA